MYPALGLSILLGAFAQIALKLGASTKSSILMTMFHPNIIIGLSLYFISALFYIYALKGIPLSIAFPCVSINYIIVAILAHYIWREEFGIQQIIACLLIIGGVSLLIFKARSHI